MTHADLQKSYSQDLFLGLVQGLVDSEFKPSKLVIKTPQTAKNISDVTNFGGFPELDVQVFAVRHTTAKDARVAVTQDIFKIMKLHNFRHALIASYSDKEAWRCSFVSSDLEISNTGRITKNFSNPRRFSFLLGEQQKVNTPYKQLVQLGSVKDVEDLKKRFALEVVNNEFYKAIAKLYDELVGTDKLAGVLKYPGQGEVSHEFAVRLIGRIIFCWFLREKRSSAGTPLVPAEVLSRTAADQNNYYHSVLAPLFFEVLNKHLRNREDKFQKGHFANIPYLNGGLFNPDPEDHYKFDKTLQMSVPGLVEVPDAWLHKFFDLLELYNFTVDENTSYDIDLSIDPEMLGRIFENLLARINPETGETVRKTTGSFYTPREIVEYMVDESLKEYLKSQTNISENKLVALASFDLTDDEEHPLGSDEKKQITEALSKVKVLDPACGSGAFPIGILQKIVFMLQQTDPEAKLWFEKQIGGASPEFRHHLEREYKNKNFDYLRKLGVIRESIYGVDIQAIATEISRLRCFLTLIVDQSVDDSEQNRGVEPLPNLDFKFVTANSLIKLGEVTTSRSSQTGLFEDQSGIEELRELRDDYFTSHNSDRESLKTRFTQVQKKMLQKMLEQRSGNFADVTAKLSAWDPFSHGTTVWFDPEWMFGLPEGFDVVIANPPYVDSEHMVKDNPELRQKYADTYKTATGNWDLYIPFIEQGYKLLNSKGILTYITPNKWLAISYGKTLREFILNSLISIVDLNGVEVFDAGNNPTIFQLLKRGSQNVNVYRMSDSYSTADATEVSKEVIANDNFGILFSQNIELVEKISMTEKKISDSFSIENPFSVSEAYEVKPFIHELKDDSNSCLKFCNTGTIKPFGCLWGVKDTRYLKDSYVAPIVKTEDFEKKFHRRYIQSTSPKIIFKGMRYFHSFYDSTGEYIAGKSTTIAVPKSETTDIYFFLGLLNSKMVFWWLKELYGTQGIDGGINFTSSMIKNIPVNEDSDLSSAISIIAKELSLNKDNGVDKLNKLNRIVYQLYKLAPEEIKIIEKES